MRNRVKEKSLEMFYYSIAELDKEDNILPTLDSYKKYIVSNLQFINIPNNPN